MAIDDVLNKTNASDFMNNFVKAGKNLFLIASMYGALNYAGDLLNSNKLNPDIKPKDSITQTVNTNQSLADKLRAFLSDELKAEDVIYIGGVPFEKKEYNFPSFNLHNVEFLVAKNPEKYQDIITSWIPGGYKKIGVPEKIFGSLSTYNNGDHVVVWYDTSYSSKTEKLLVGTMALAKAMRDEIERRFKFKPDLYLIDTTNFNERNKFKLAKETGYYRDYKAREVIFPAITIYHNGFLVDGVLQGENFNISPEDIEPLLNIFYDDPGYSTDMINKVPK